MQRKKAKRIEKEIIITLIRNNRPLTINEISKLSGISWITIKKYIPGLKELKVIENLKQSSKISLSRKFKESIADFFSDKK